MSASSLPSAINVVRLAPTVEVAGEGLPGSKNTVAEEPIGTPPSVPVTTAVPAAAEVSSAV
ncbi:hypothetical protein D1872_282460 [compost metagenome]